MTNDPKAGDETVLVPPLVERKKRLIGLDLARGLAILGMLVSHVGPQSWVADGGTGQTIWFWEFSHSRLPAMFAVVAGVSLALMSGGRFTVNGESQKRVVIRTVVRAVLLAVLGLALTALHTPAAVILVYFALYFLLAIPMMRVSARSLFVLAAIWSIAGPLASALARTNLEVSNRVWTYLVAGDYPVLTWMPFVLVGMAIGRLDLHQRGTRRRLLIGGTVIATAAYGLSALVLDLGGREMILNSLIGAGITRGQALAQYGELFHGETGVAPIGSWMWQMAAAPHSGTVIDVVGCIGVCLALLGLLLSAGEWIARAQPKVWRLPIDVLLEALGSAGQLSLTIYAGHIFAMWAINKVFGYDFVPAQPVFVLFSFVVVILAFSWIWVRWVGRGPLEWLLHVSSMRVANLLVPTLPQESDTSAPENPEVLGR